MAKAGLVILTQPLSHLKSFIPRLIEEAAVVVSDTLYICLQPGQVPNGAEQLPSPLIQPILGTKQLLNFTTELYSSGSRVCHSLDVRILLSHICPQPATYSHSPYNLREEISVLLSDSEKIHDLWKIQKPSLVDSLRASFTNVYGNIDFHFLKVEQRKDAEVENREPIKTYPNVVIGGTFDRLHVGHKLLLTESSMRAESKLTVGITDGKMNEKKSLWEVMQAYSVREKNVVGFVNEVKPSIVMEPARIEDPFGPTITNSDLQAIVVSQETLRGGNMVNEEREKRGFPTLDVAVIDLVGDACRSADEEEKVSSSSFRKRLLGTVIKPTAARSNISKTPYRIGVTGGIASGKSNICKELGKLGGRVIDGDLLGHKAYLKDTAAFRRIVEEFGQEVVGDDGEINRKKLGPIVFSDKAKLDKLNSIVWPAIRELAENEIARCQNDGVSVVVLEAAILLEANWGDMVHEIWSAFVPRTEAIKRIAERNNLSQADAEKRIDSQISNQARIAQSNVVFCSLWEYEYTRKQVEKAWNLLKSRLPESSTVSSL